MRSFVCLLVLLLAVSFVAPAQTKSPSNDELLQAMRSCAAYASNVLLDENGKSRCDYSVMDGKWFDYEPAWHTGQLINGLVDVYRITKDERTLAAAKRAGDWWVSLEIKDHPKLKGMVRAIHGDGVNFIVCATVTDGTPGLFNLYRVTKEKKYAEVPTAAGEWMLQNMYMPKEGMFYDLVDPETGEVQKTKSAFWPEESKPLLNNVARVNNEGSLFKDMYEFTRNEKYKEVFVNLCESMVAKQGPEGLWMQFTPNNASKSSFHPRFNLWNAESLLEGFVLTGKKEYLAAAHKTLKFYTKYQKKDGTIYYENYLDGRSNENSVTGSTVAMAGLLWLKYQQLAGGNEFQESIERSIRWIVANRFSDDHPDKNLAGATMNIRTRTKGGKLYLTQRDLGTSFSMRFLAAYYNNRFESK